MLNLTCSFKIRELLNSELDDGLLDDDNASFSSHDLRSSGYSQDTPYSEDFTEQEHQTIINGQETKTLIPSEGGAFERPPLVTQRAFHFINGSGQNQDSNAGMINQPYKYDSGHHYEQHHDHPVYFGYREQGSSFDGQVDTYKQSDYSHPGYFGYREQESPFDDQVDEHKQSFDHSGGDSNYPKSPDDDDVDEEFEQYGTYQPHYPTANGSDVHDFDEDYGGYTGEDTSGHGQNLYDNSAKNVDDENHYRMDTPGNYRVQYHKQNEAFPRISDRGSDRHATQTNKVANDFLGDGSQDVQLQILYKARGRKIEELTRKLESQEEEMTKQIRVLNHQNALMKGTCTATFQL